LLAITFRVRCDLRGSFACCRNRALYNRRVASDDRNLPRDPTPVSGAPTDVAPVVRGASKPPHERTADEERDLVEWDKIAATDSFRQLLAEKRRFIIPAMIFFVVYYFSLPVLVGYFPRLMERKVLGSVNIAYLFALSQFFMAWAVAAFYVRVAAKWDRMAADIRGTVGQR
jgi:uncharacterized membrane protein (DUF485 family)